MSRAVMDACVDRLAKHARRYDLSRVSVILHGGEPLLAGPGRLARLLGRLRRAFAGLPTEFDLLVQTNGVLLDERFLQIFDRFAVSVGVSLDGDAVAHDRHRVDHRGRGSYAVVASALALLRHQRHRHLFGGVLCTVDVRNDPVQTYESLLAHEPPMIDLLLPHGTWDTPPPGLPTAATPYGDWLIAVFDRWYDNPGPRPRVRRFESLVDLCLGGWSATESLGQGPSAALVVETDGSVETHDTLKVVGSRIGATGLTVLTNDLDKIVGPPQQLGAKCRACPVVEVCGGGLRTHRYRSPFGFANESVYCRDLKRFIDHVQWRLTRDLMTPSAQT